MNKRKKIFSIAILFILVLTLSGCGNTENQQKNNNTNDSNQTTVTCTKTGEITTGVDSDLTYQYTEKDGYVQTVYTIEKITTDNENYLDDYRALLEGSYEPYKDIEYYDYEISIKGNTLTSKVTIDYAKIDTDQLLAIDSSNASLIKNGKVATKDLQSLYESIGATCK